MARKLLLAFLFMGVLLTVPVQAQSTPSCYPCNPGDSAQLAQAQSDWATLYAIGEINWFQYQFGNAEMLVGVMPGLLEQAYSAGFDFGGGYGEKEGGEQDDD